MLYASPLSWFWNLKWLTNFKHAVHYAWNMYLYYIYSYLTMHHSTIVDHLKSLSNLGTCTLYIHCSGQHQQTVDIYVKFFWVRCYKENLHQAGIGVNEGHFHLIKATNSIVNPFWVKGGWLRNKGYSLLSKEFPCGNLWCNGMWTYAQLASKNYHAMQTLIPSFHHKITRLSCINFVT